MPYVTRHVHIVHEEKSVYKGLVKFCVNVPNERIVENQRGRPCEGTVALMKCLEYKVVFWVPCDAINGLYSVIRRLIRSPFY